MTPVAKLACCSTLSDMKFITPVTSSIFGKKNCSSTRWCCSSSSCQSLTSWRNAWMSFFVLTCGAWLKIAF